MDDDERFPHKGGSFVELNFPGAQEEIWLCADEGHEDRIREALTVASKDVSPYGTLCKRLLDEYNVGNTDELILELPFGPWPRDFSNQIANEWQPHIFLSYGYEPFKRPSAWTFIWLPSSYVRTPKILTDVLYVLAKHNAPWLVDEVISGRLELPKGVSLSTSTRIERRLCPIKTSPSSTLGNAHPTTKVAKHRVGGRRGRYDRVGVLIPIMKKLFSPTNLPPNTEIARKIEAELTAMGLSYGKDYVRRGLVPKLLEEAFGILRT